MKTNSVGYRALQTAYDYAGTLTRELDASVKRVEAKREQVGIALAGNVPIGGRVTLYPLPGEPPIVIDVSRLDKVPDIVRKINDALGFEYAYATPGT